MFSASNEGPAQKMQQGTLGQPSEVLEGRQELAETQYWSISGKKRIGKIWFFIKTVFLTIQVEIVEVWRTAPSIRSYMQIFCRFGLTWYRKVNFSTFSGKQTFQSSRNGSQNLPFCPESLQDTFIIFPRYLINISRT